jgi:hypothetical protein
MARSIYQRHYILVPVTQPLVYTFYHVNVFLHNLKITQCIMSMHSYTIFGSTWNLLLPYTYKWSSSLDEWLYDQSSSLFYNHRLNINLTLRWF